MARIARPIGINGQVLMRAAVNAAEAEAESREQASVERLMKLISNAGEDVLRALWEQCRVDFLSICNREDVPEGAYTIVEQMVAYRYSQLNAEGLSAQSFSGMSESFLSDYPERLKRSMYRYRRLKMV